VHVRVCMYQMYEREDNNQKRQPSAGATIHAIHVHVCVCMYQMYEREERVEEERW
jgi:hypothetical protein